MLTSQEAASRDEGTSNVAGLLMQSMFPILKQHSRLRAVRSGTILQQQMQMRPHKLESMRFVTPFTWAIRQWWFQLSFAAVGIYLLTTSAITIASLPGYGIGTFQQFKLEIVGNSVSDMSWVQNTVLKVQLQFEGCEVWSGNIMGNSFTAGNQIAVMTSEPVSFLHTVRVDAFSVALDLAWVAPTSVRFDVKGTNDNGTTWSPAISSETRLAGGGLRFLNRTRSFAAGKQYSFETAASWALVLYVAVNRVLLGIGCIGTSILGILNRPAAGTSWFVICCTVLMLNMAAACIGYFINGSAEAFFSCVQGMCYATMAWSLTYAESIFAESLAVVGLISLLGSIIQDCAISQDCSYVVDSPPYTELVMMITGCTFVVLRLRYLDKAIRAVKSDHRAYDQEWSALLSIPSQLELLYDLRQVSNMIEEECNPQLARQLNRVRAEATEQQLSVSIDSLRHSSPVLQNFGESGVDLSAAVPCTRDINNPIFSLDQLYAQATGLVCHFHGKCAHWASSSSGAVENIDAGEQRERMPRSPTLNIWIERHFVKSPERAVEKALTCYQSDVSRLLDICRGRIVFSNITDLLSCLQTIHFKDSETKILRIKNSLHTQYDSQLTGGFRGVVLNVCILTAETKALGVENHVCELQLLLSCLSCSQCGANGHAERHLRFVRFREARPHYPFRKRIVVSKNKVVPEESIVNLEGGAGGFSKGMLQPTSGNSPSLGQERRENDKASSLRSEGVLPGNTQVQVQEPQLEQSVEILDSENAIVAGMESAVTEEAELYFNIYLRSTLRAGGYLDSQASKAQEAFFKSNAGSSWFTSQPFTAASTKKVFKLSNLAITLFFFYKFCRTIGALRANGLIRTSLVCMDVLGLRNPLLPINEAKMVSFGLLLNGCRVPANESVWLPSNGSICLAFADQVQANGYFFSTSNESTSYDPVRWIVRSSVNKNNGWQVIGASTWRVLYDGTLKIYPNVPFSTPETRNTQVRVDFRLPWPWFFDYTMVDLCTWVGLGSIIVASLIGRFHDVKMMWTSTAFSLVISEFIGFVGFLTIGPWLEALRLGMNVVQALILAICTSFFSTKFIQVLIFNGLLFDLCIVINFTLVYQSDRSGLLEAVIASGGTILSVFGICAYLYRRRVLRNARQLVIPDQKRYDEMWSAMTQSEGARSVLVDLKNLVNHLSTRCKKAVVQQCNRPYNLCQRTSSFHFSKNAVEMQREIGAKTREIRIRRWSTYSKVTASGVLDTNTCHSSCVDLNSPVNNLDQLFIQASLLHPILLEKVKFWAMSSGGSFLREESKEYVKYEEAVNQPDTRIKWGKVKSVSRAVEKMFRTYNQDSSKLVDVCRQSIAFEELQGVLSCLRVIADDPDVEVLRVKNRMDLGFDAAESAGYRNLAINLRIVTQETIDLGVELHVCEVQIIPRPIADLKVRLKDHSLLNHAVENVHSS